MVLYLTRNEILGANEESLRPNHTSLLDVIDWIEYYSIPIKGKFSNVVLGDYVHECALAYQKAIRPHIVIAWYGVRDAQPDCHLLQ